MKSFTNYSAGNSGNVKSGIPGVQDHNESIGTVMQTIAGAGTTGEKVVRGIGCEDEVEIWYNPIPETDGDFQNFQAPDSPDNYTSPRPPPRGESCLPRYTRALSQSFSHGRRGRKATTWVRSPQTIHKLSAGVRKIGARRRQQRVCRESQQHSAEGGPEVVISRYHLDSSVAAKMENHTSDMEGYLSDGGTSVPDSRSSSVLPCELDPSTFSPYTKPTSPPCPSVAISGLLTLRLFGAEGLRIPSSGGRTYKRERGNVLERTFEGSEMASSSGIAVGLQKSDVEEIKSEVNGLGRMGGGGSARLLADGPGGPGDKVEALSESSSDEEQLRQRGWQPPGRKECQVPHIFCAVQVDGVTRARTARLYSEASRLPLAHTFTLSLECAHTLRLLLFSWTSHTPRRRIIAQGMVSLSLLLPSEPINNGTMPCTPHRLAVALQPHGVLYAVLTMAPGGQVRGNTPVESSETHEARVFGVDLATVVRREDSGIGVSLLLHSCVAEIEERGLQTVGLYRLCGSAAGKRALRAEFEESSASVNLSAEYVTDINVITGVLKDFLRELPGPLISSALCHNLLCISPRPVNREGKRDGGRDVDSGSESGEETVNEIGMRKCSENRKRLTKTSEGGGRMDVRDVCEDGEMGRDNRKVEVMRGTEKEKHRKETKREKEVVVEREEREDVGAELDCDGKKPREPENMKMHKRTVGRGPTADLLKCLPEPERATLSLLLSHLRRVASHSSANKMTLQNLAVCFAPVLLGAGHNGRGGEEELGSSAPPSDLANALRFKRNIHLLHKLLLLWPDIEDQRNEDLEGAKHKESKNEKKDGEQLEDLERDLPRHGVNTEMTNVGQEKESREIAVKLKVKTDVGLKTHKEVEIGVENVTEEPGKTEVEKALQRLNGGENESQQGCVRVRQSIGGRVGGRCRPTAESRYARDWSEFLRQEEGHSIESDSTSTSLPHLHTPQILKCPSVLPDSLDSQIHPPSSPYHCVSINSAFPLLHPPHSSASFSSLSPSGLPSPPVSPHLSPSISPCLPPTTASDNVPPFPVWKQEEDATPFPVWKQEENATPFPVWKQEEDATPSTAWKPEENATPSPVWKQEEDATPSPVWKQEEDATPSPIWKQEEDATPSTAWKPEENATPSPVWKQEEDATPSPVWKQEEDATPSPVWKQEEDASRKGGEGDKESKDGNKSDSSLWELQESLDYILHQIDLEILSVSSALLK
uniref:uncharacterized protein n=1 Tax=Myxine glutinosa TaxID=7769 RepID=UPI00358F52C8